MSGSELDVRLKRLESATDLRDRRVAELEETVKRLASAAAPDTEALRKQVTELTAERTALADRVRDLEAVGTRPTPVQISQAFRDAAAALAVGLAARPGDRHGFAVDAMDVDLRVTAALDADGSVRLALPQPADRIDPAALSGLRFTLRSVPVAPAAEELIVVPSLIGLSRGAALAALTKAGLKPGREETRDSPSVPGTVIGQSPDPGDELAADRGVDLLLAAAPLIAVPDLSGATREEAEARLAAAGLSLAVSGAPEGPVRGQTPPAGEHLPRGGLVTVEFTPPAAPRTMPDLLGQRVEVAVKRLEAEEVAVRTRPANAPARQEGTVLGQDPPSGATVIPGAVVTLSVGRRDAAPILRLLAEHAEFRRVGVPADVLADRLRAAGGTDAEGLAKLAALPAATVQERLGLPTPRGATALIKALGETLAADDGA